jgi:hypothetical protein
MPALGQAAADRAADRARSDDDVSHSPNSGTPA